MDSPKCEEGWLEGHDAIDPLMSMDQIFFPFLFISLARGSGLWALWQASATPLPLARHN